MRHDLNKRPASLITPTDSGDVPTVRVVLILLEEQHDDPGGTGPDAGGIESVGVQERSEE